MQFVNQAAFDESASHALATGHDLNIRTSFLDPAGNVLFRSQTGGMISPEPAEIPPGESLYRFANASAGAEAAMNGSWWIGSRELERIVRFGQINELSDPMAARILLGVPPQWQTMDLLIKVSVREPLLAWRGLANTVIVPHPDGGPKVQMLHQNAIAERRLPQLFIPGLRSEDDWSIAYDVLIFEGEWRFSKAEAMRGWLYV
jgi:hypothetical protein